MIHEQNEVVAMNKEILLVAEAVSNEKAVAKGLIFRAIEAALEMATKKRYANQEVDVLVTIDQTTGDYKTIRRWLVVEDNSEDVNPVNQLILTQAKERNAKIKVGEFIEEAMES